MAGCGSRREPGAPMDGMEDGVPGLFPGHCPFRPGTQ